LPNQEIIGWNAYLLRKQQLEQLERKRQAARR
jgi:hypothetical protein